MEPTLELVLEWARQAARIAVEMQTHNIEKRYKNDIELVTAADTAVEDYLLGQIQRHFPSHSINAEESGEQNKDLEHKWYVDPIDGTINYAHGLPMYGISVAYAHHGVLEIGVLCFPSLKEEYWAVRGLGAFRNGEKIAVSEVASLKEAVVATGFRAYLIDTPRSNINNFIRFTKEAQTVRRLGSAALNLAYVAGGLVDGFWEVELSPWDIAAGILILREAGGIVKGIIDQDADLLSGKADILAANPKIYPQMREILLQEHATQA